VVTLPGGCDTSSTLASVMASTLLHPLLASDVTFAVLFGIFVVALAVLVVLTLMWVVRRDRALRADWRARQQQKPGMRQGDGSTNSTGT
jgi:hypothetical protein